MFSDDAVIGLGPFLTAASEIHAYAVAERL